MRSAVSAILSAPAPDTRMSHPDYRQTAHDHSALLVLVRHIGRQLKQKSFERVLERIRRVSRLRVVVDPSAAAAASASGAAGGPPWPREITARYVTDYPVENNDWGDFQTHRRVLGLVSVGKCDSQQELNELCRVHESLKVKYASTLFDSRCVVFGLYPDGTPVVPQTNTMSPSAVPLCNPSIPQSPTLPSSPSPPLASSEDLSTPSPPPYQRLGKLADNGEGGHGDEENNSVDRVSPLPEDENTSALIVSRVESRKTANDDAKDTMKINAISPGSPTPIISSDPLQDLMEEGGQPVKVPRSKKKRPPPPPPPNQKDVTPIIENTGQNNVGEERRPVRPTNIDLKHKLKPANMSSPTPSSATASSCSSLPSSPSTPSSSSSPSNPTPPAAPFSTPSNFKTRPLFYPDLESAIGKGPQSSAVNGPQDLESAMREFLASLFWVLESKRLVLAGNKSGTGTGSSSGPLGSAGSAITAPTTSVDGNLPSLPYCAPFERRDFVGLSLDSRAARRRWAGRALKRLGDLSCQAGAPAQAAAAYASAAETLRAANDWLWLGGAYEGHCSVSVCVLYPNPTLIPPLQRNASFPDGMLGGVTNGGSPGKRRPSPTLSPSRSSSSVASTPSPTTCSSSAQSPSPTTSSPTTSLASTPSSSSSGSSSANGTAGNAPDVRNCLSADDIMKKYREAIVFYSQYQHAGVIEMEACFKAARVAIELNRPLQASCFLQNVVLSNPNLDEDEKIQRFITLSDLYWRMGFGRKASMCLRLAALRHVSPSIPQPQWDVCHSLLLGALTRGHKVSLDPTVFPGDGLHPGWPKLQIQVLRELIFAARSMGNGALATRHLTFLVQTMWHHMSTNEKKELCNQLRSLTTAHGDGSPVPLVLPSTGLVVPPANLTHLPQALSFQVQDLAPHLRPRRLQEASKEDSGPFLFTPLHFGSLDRSTLKNSGKLEFSWVEGEVCEVAMKVSNPLPFELKVSNMRLLTDELVFETVPSSLSLPTESSPHPVSLKGIPKETGELHILGYSTHVLGVKSNCRLRDLLIPGVPKLPRIVLKVVPALPLATVSTSLPRSATFSSLASSSVSSGMHSRQPGVPTGAAEYSVVTSASASLYAGESQECTITITNSGHVPIEMLNVTMAGIDGLWGGEIPSGDCDEDEGKIFRWSKENVASQLPIAPGASASFTLYLYAAGKFLGSLPLEGSGMDGVPDGEDGGDYSSLASSLLRGGSSMGPTSGSSSLPSRLGGGRDRRPDSAASFGSLRSGGSIRSNTSSAGSSASASVASGRVPNLPELHGAHWQNSVQSIEGLLKIQYSGGPGMAGGFCRVCSVALSMEIRPSVRLTNWDVIPAETPSQFYLVLDAINTSGSELELRYTPIKSILMEAGESCRVPIPLQRCPLSKLLSHSHHRKHSPRASPASRRMDAADVEGIICSKHISSLVDLRWNLPGTGTRGKASLSGVQCSREMLQIIKASPLIWEVTVNSELVRPQEEITCKVGDSLRLGVRIKVCSGLGTEDPSSPGYTSSNKMQSQTISVSHGHNGVNFNSDQSKQSEGNSSRPPSSDSNSETLEKSARDPQQSTFQTPHAIPSIPENSALNVPPIVEPGSLEMNPSTDSGDTHSPQFTMPKLALSLRFFQDHRNGVNNYLLDTLFATAGAVNNVPLPQLSEGGEAYHEAAVVFFTPGQYKVDISCSSMKDGPSGFLSKTVPSSETSSTTWRFVPPIEITVEDVLSSASLKQT